MRPGIWEKIPAARAAASLRWLAAASALALCGTWTVPAAADAIPPRINMNIGTEKFEPGVVKTIIRDDTGIARVLLFYRAPGESYYNSVEMEKRNDLYYKELTRELGLSGPVEYYILAQDTSGNETTQPRIAPEENPLTTAAGNATNQSAPEIHLSSPAPGAVVETADEPIMVTFYTTERQVDFNTVRFRVDGQDRTGEADFLGNVLYWQPQRPLAEGNHEIEVTAKDTNGEYIGPNIWSIQVRTRRALPLGAEGDFYLGLQRDDRSGDAGEVPLWNNKIDFTMKGKTGPMEWTAGALLSSEESSFLTSETIPDRQPVNRFHLDGRTTHFRLRLGDSNPNLSELTLKGILVRGLNLQFDSSRFSGQFVRGYNKRTIDQDINIIAKNVTRTGTDQYIDEDGNTHTLTSGYQSIIPDPVTNQLNVYEFNPGTFKRNVTALKLNVTPVKRRIAAWTVGVNFFSAEDDTTSLNYRYDTENDTRIYSFAAGDTTTTFNTEYNPKKNWVGTVGTSVRFNENRSELSAEFGGTMVTENMFGTLTEDMMDELPSGIDDNLFRFNASTQTSFDKQKLADNIGQGAMDAIRSVYMIRLTTPLPIPKVRTDFKSELYRIPTHYVSLGNPQQKTDVGGYRLNVRSRLVEDQVTLNLGYEAYADNLDNENTQFAGFDNDGAPTGQKTLTKDTTVSSVSVSLSPHIWAAYAPMVSVGYREYASLNDLDIRSNGTGTSLNDPLEMVDSGTNTLTLTLGGTLPVGYQKHTGTVSITTMDITDNRPVPVYQLNESENLSWMFNLNSALDPLPVNLTGSFGFTGNTAYRPVLDDQFLPIDRKQITTDIVMLNLAGTYKWFRDKRLATSLGIGFLGSDNGETDQYGVKNAKYTYKLEADYKYTQAITFGGELRFINYKDDANPVINYTEPILGFTMRTGF